jgi:hypothetical protein
MTSRKVAKNARVVTKSTRATSLPADGKDREGGLTAKGRKFYKDSEGANLRPGIKGATDTPEKMKRKGSFLTRHSLTHEDRWSKTGSQPVWPLAHTPGANRFRGLRRPPRSLRQRDAPYYVNITPSRPN